MFYENCYCGSERNYTGYCDQETDRLIDQQSVMTDFNKRREIVWEIERRLALGCGTADYFSPAPGDLHLSAGQGHHDRGQ